MPNWCEGDLKVSGPTAAVQAFAARARSDPKESRLRTRLEGSLGEEEQQKALIDALHNKKEANVLNHDVFVPMPEELENTTSPPENTPTSKKLMKKYGVSNWYDWNCKFLGSKWGISHATIVKEGPRSITYAFESAWSPVLPVIQAMSEQHPELLFTYDAYEMGCGFQIHTQCKAGKWIKMDESSYSGHRGG